ncbi:MAG: hypothetical protein ACJA13_002260 [Paraglaciecola sp.]|jgi:hypothetical protein
MKVLLVVFILIAASGLIWFTNQSDEAALSTESTRLPVITRQDILSASDLVEGVKQAVKEDDEKAIELWLEKAANLANTAGLPPQDVNYIESDKAKNYLLFGAKRSLFNDSVEQAYYTLDDIETVKSHYPEARDLFAQADKLFSDRDSIIQQIATELAGDEQPNEQIMDEARALFKERFVTNSH